MDFTWRDLVFVVEKKEWAIEKYLLGKAIIFVGAEGKNEGPRGVIGPGIRIPLADVSSM